MAFAVWWIVARVVCRHPGDWDGAAGLERRRVWLTLRLLEWRAWMAGRPRPAGSTLRNWYQPVLTQLPPEPARSLRSLLPWGDWSLYAGTGTLTLDDRVSLRSACADAAKRCTTRQLYQSKRK